MIPCPRSLHLAMILATLSTLSTLSTCARAEGPTGDGAWRRLGLSQARLAEVEAELHEALRRKWPKRLLDFSVELEGARVETDGTSFRLIADRGRLLLRRGTVGDLPITGEHRFEEAHIDYAGLGVGRFQLLEDLWTEPTLRISLQNLGDFLGKSGFEDVEVEYHDEQSQLELRGARPIHFLCFRLRPSFRVRARLFTEGLLMGITDPDLSIRGLPRFVVSLVHDRLQARMEQRVDLRKEYDKLSRHHLRIRRGFVEVTRPEGLIMRREVPGDRELGSGDGVWIPADGK